METHISVVINTLNEEANIADCMRSVQGLADEIVVCDMYSDDRTVEIAESLGGRIVSHERTNFVEPARYYAISQASYEWVLVLDADERMTESLANKLKVSVVDNNVDIVSFWSLYWYFGGWVRHGGFFNHDWPRFFRKKVYLHTYNSSEELVHGNFRALKKSSDKKLQLPSDFYILHLAYPSIEKYISKTLGMYARIEAEQYFQNGRRFSLLRLLGEPIKEVLQRFFFKGGYRDGVRGFILAVLYAGYRFTTWANLWFLEEQEKQNTTQSPTQNNPQKGR